MVTASADAFAERATWQDFLPGSAEAVSLHPAADEFYYGTCASTQGCAHTARKPRRSKIRHAISLARWLHALAYSTWRAWDAVRKGTQSEQARLSGNRSPTHEMANRDYHMQLTTHFLLIHPLLLTAKICLLQLRACMRRRDPYHVPSQTDLINHCSHLPSFETKTSNKMASVKEARHELDPWNDNCPKTWSLKQ